MAALFFCLFDQEKMAPIFGVDPILRMFVFPYSNGITEGFHRKMKLIQRRAYGFRNFMNYRLRVIVLCGHLPQGGL